MTRSVDERAPLPAPSMVTGSAYRRPSTWLALGLGVMALGMVTFLAVAIATPEAAQLADRTGSLAEAAGIILTVLSWLSMLSAGTRLRPPAAERDRLAAAVRRFHHRRHVLR